MSEKWTYQPESHLIVNEQSRVLARVQQFGLHEHGYKMAAAPQLYGALFDALESLKRLPDTEGAHRVTCIQRAHAALAKARGEG